MLFYSTENKKHKQTSKKQTNKITEHLRHTLVKQVSIVVSKSVFIYGVVLFLPSPPFFSLFKLIIGNYQNHSVLYWIIEVISGPILLVFTTPLLIVFSSFCCCSVLVIVTLSPGTIRWNQSEGFWFPHCVFWAFPLGFPWAPHTCVSVISRTLAVWASKSFLYSRPDCLRDFIGKTLRWVFFPSILGLFHEFTDCRTLQVFPPAESLSFFNLATIY